MSTHVSRCMCGLLAAVAIGTSALATPQHPQYPPEVRRAGHVLRRVQHGVSLEDLLSLVPTGSQSQTALIAQYLLDQLNLAQPENAETQGLSSLYAQFPALGSSLGPTPPAQPWDWIAQPQKRWTVEQLTELEIIHSVFSEYQLRAKLARFWKDLFNTNYWTLYGYFRETFSKAPYNIMGPQLEQMSGDYAAYFKWWEHDRYMSHAFGPFRTVLEDSATSVSMLIYLDGVNNKAPDLNENYGRELQELHTLGVRSPYWNGSQWIEVPSYAYEDVRSASKIFSGWGIRDSSPAQPTFAYFFDGTKHFIESPPRSYVIYDSTLPPDDPSGFYMTPHVPKIHPAGATVIVQTTASDIEGRQLMTHLANSAVTANYISRRLYKVFVSEQEPAANDPLIAACIGAWGNGQGGNIIAVLATLLGSDRFLNDTNIRWDLARTPMDGVGQTVAAFRGKAYNPADLPVDNRRRIQRFREALEEKAGRLLNTYPSPEGYSSAGHDQLTTQRLIVQNELRQEIYGNWNLANYPWVPQFISYDWLGLLAQYQISITSELALTNFFSLVLFQGDEGVFDWAFLYDFLWRTSSGAKTTQSLAAVAQTNFTEYQNRLTQALSFAASLSLNNLK